MIDRMLRDRLVDAYVGMIPLITLNLVWLIASLPLVTLIPATAALFYATNRLAHGRSADWHTFVEGFRLYFWRSWQWGLLNVAVIVVFASNLLFYSSNLTTTGSTASVIVALLALVWLAIQMQAFPLLIEQEQPKLTLALRNSLVIVLKRPFFSLGAALLIAVIAAVSTLVIQPAWFFITASACAYLANKATLNSIALITGKPLDDAPERKP